MARPARPVGTITRGTTNPNRLRRCDRWIAGPQGWRLRRSPTPPVVVDLGYGASPITAVELHDRLRQVRPDVQVVGIEIDPERVAAGRPLERNGLTFRLGGFEVPLDDGMRPTVVRAFNVLRQYAEHEVADAWAMVQDRWQAKLRHEPALKARTPELEAAVAAGRLPPTAAAEESARALGL